MSTSRIRQLSGIRRCYSSVAFPSAVGTLCFTKVPYSTGKCVCRTRCDAEVGRQERRTETRDRTTAGLNLLAPVSRIHKLVHTQLKDATNRSLRLCTSFYSIGLRCRSIEHCFFPCRSERCCDAQNTGVSLSYAAGVEPGSGLWHLLMW